MEDDYYSVESILGENQKVQCTFKVTIPDMGHLDGGSERDIKPASKIQVPLWLAYILIYSDYADFTIPKPFSLQVRNALNAEPRSVQLSKQVGQGAQWYGFGRSIMRLLDDEPAAEISDVLVKAFRGRLPEVVDQAQHYASSLGPGAGSGNDSATLMFREGLDITERELFALAQESVRNTRAWYDRSDRGKR